MTYPNFVTKNRPKGSIVKFKQGKYYVYKATSKRVEGKKYPVQIIEGMIGYIDEEGFHENSKRVVEIKGISIRECGFSNFLLRYEEAFKKESYPLLSTLKIKVKDFHRIFCSIIVYLSPSSYLNDEVNIIPIKQLADEYGISIIVWMNRLQRFLELELKEIEWMKYICRVKIGDKIYKSDLSEEVLNRIKELEINADEIR